MAQDDLANAAAPAVPAARIADAGPNTQSGRPRFGARQKLPKSVRMSWSFERARRVLAAGLLCLAVLLAAPRAWAQSLEADAGLQRALLAMFSRSGAPGMVVAVVRGDEVMVQGFGQVRAGRSDVPDGETLVRLGSISKLFAGETLACLAVEGRLGLHDALQRWAPRGLSVPSSPGAAPITLVNLASHTSGLPRLAGLGYQPDPALAAADRWRWLSRARVAAPGRQAVYSNIAFDILADALSAAAGEPYTRALQRRITGPLSLGDTTASPNTEQCARLMDGSTAGAWAACRDTSANAGSGGLYSTADDMAQWMRHQLAIGGPPSPALRASQAIYFPRSALTTIDGLDRAGQASGIGLGWVALAATPTHPRLIEKTGGGWGFMTYVALAPGRRSGIFVAISSHQMTAMPPLAARVNDLVGALAR